MSATRRLWSTGPAVVALAAACAQPAAVPARGKPSIADAPSARQAGHAPPSVASAAASPSARQAPTVASPGPSAAPTDPTPIRRAAARVRTDWPCAGCSVRLPPSERAEQPAPMLVLLHGDDGNTSYLDWLWHAATDGAGVVLVVVRCPMAKGYGAPRWTVWQRSGEHEPGWLRARVAEVATEERIDPARVYAAGYSSGATYLSWLQTSQPPLFAAVSLVAGGRKPESSCSASKTPVYMLIGSLDTMLVADVQPLREWYRACGHEVEWDLRQGMTHEGILWAVERGGAERILAWMLQRH